MQFVSQSCQSFIKHLNTILGFMEDILVKVYCLEETDQNSMTQNMFPDKRIHTHLFNWTAAVLANADDWCWTSNIFKHLA